MSREELVPALRFRWLTAFYDPLMERWTAAKRVRQAVLEALDLRPGLRLLELGCGPGRLAIEIKRRWPGVTIDAVDGDARILQLARRHAADAGLEIAFREVDITRLPEMGPFDRAYSTLVFHHLTAGSRSPQSGGLRRLRAERHAPVDASSSMSSGVDRAPR